MRKFIVNFVASCTCSKWKSSRSAGAGQLHPLPIADTPWTCISTDFIVSLPPSKGFNAINVWVDRFTKMCHFIPCNDTVSSPQLVEMFLSNVVKLHGLPSSIVSDQGPQFVSSFWKEVCDKLKISADLSSAYHPESDGQTERVNAILEQYLRCFTCYNQDDWVELLPLAEFAVNNSVSSTTNQSPFFSNYGFNPRAFLGSILALNSLVVCICVCVF